MGICFSASPKPSSFQTKPSFPKSVDDHGADSPRRSLTLPDLTVLKDPPAEKIFDKYRFDKELGRGEFGITYQCFDIETGEAFACKTISKSKLRTEIDVEDVRREVDIMRHLPKHPNIVAFIEAYEDQEAVYLVMELCSGGELFTNILCEGHYNERAAANVTRTILEILKVCHEHGVIHRDLKPENFLFADACEASPIKAIDFGLSIFFEPGETFCEIVGSPYYIAPEVLRRNYGKEIDVWSAGVILYILLSGVPPFWAETEEGIEEAIVECAIDFERDPWPTVSEDAKDLVMSMLDPNPLSRLTVQEVLEHPWICNLNQAPNVSLGENVTTRIKQFSLMNKFKKRVLLVVADQLPNEQIAKFKQMFQLIDTDKNGDLSVRELKDGFHIFGHPHTDPDMRMLLEDAGLDVDGTLSFDEFVALSVHLKNISNEEHLFQAFNFFDKDASGYIEFDELREALLHENLGPNDEHVIKDIIADVDLDKDGKISYDEFKAMMKTGMDWKMASRPYSKLVLKALSYKMSKEKSLLSRAKSVRRDKSRMSRELSLGRDD